MSSNKRPRTNGGPQPEEDAEPKARKACINCRRQKMKCVAGNGDRCRRCHRAGIPCVFVPRANAASLPPGLLASAVDRDFKNDVIRRLKVIENCLGLSAEESTDATVVMDSPDDDLDDVPPEYSSLGALWEAAATLKKCTPVSAPASIWRKKTVGELWSAFHDRMPGLHFMPRKQTFSAPQPILLASILYCSSSRGPPESAEMAGHYFNIVCNAIAQLSVPDSDVGRPPDQADAVEEWAFQTVLGIVLAGLLTEANVKVTGIWISVAYRLILEHCPAHMDETSREWRKLFSGVQIVDLEHASLHLSCPVIPIESPLSALQTSHRDQLYRLSRMMHTGLTHFTGRGLPTIWSCFTSNPVPSINVTSTFTAVDAAVIRDWARQLDEWLVEFSNTAEGSEQDRKVVFRQYVLHRLVVLSIYHPARGCDLWSNSMTPKESRELLLSARATLKLHLHDDSIWSNWDLVMITWAALIVIQGVEGGAGEPDDLNNIRIHLEMLKQTNAPKPSLCDKLISRLEDSLQGVNTPDSAALQQQATYLETAGSGSSFDYAWQIFDQSSLQQIPYPIWPDSNQVDQMPG